MVRAAITDPRRLAGWKWILVGAAIFGLAPALHAAEPSVVSETPAESTPTWDRETIVEVRLLPDQVTLGSAYEYVQLLCTAQLSSGETVDLTRELVLAEPSERVEWTAGGILRPKASGQEVLQLEAAGRRFELPVTVAESLESDVDFIRDVAPVISRLGCNAGTCHGSNEGKNGFKLSLRGYDYEFDHRALTDDVRARRFNRAAPDQSLMLLKATATVPHTGGQLIQPDDVYYRMLRQWIASGCKLNSNSPRVTKIELQPQNPVVPLPGMQQQMRVVAWYSDGSQRDVTREAFVESGNIEVIASGKHGLIDTLRRGEAPVLARYEGAYAATTITIMGDRGGFEWVQRPEHNYIDELVDAKLKRVKVTASDLCTDEEFIRRVYLDLTGLPPSSSDVREFVEDSRPSIEKRGAWIDRLIGSPEYIQYWTNKWADLLQVNRKFLGREGAAVFRGWIEQAVASNMPYDEFARKILTASGANLDNPPASYWKILRDPAEAMENTTHLFLAVRFNCNKCHDHPFERWTQDQYYQLAAFFAQVERKEHPAYRGQRIGGTAVETPLPVVEVIYDAKQGEVTHARTGEVAVPKFPYVDGDGPPEGDTRREALAEWITSPENRYFATSMANRIWGYLLGVGLIEPIDDIRAGNPPTNPELLNALTDDFIQSGFDIQHLMRTICRSRTYQLSLRTDRWNADDKINYSHAIPKRLPAEVLYDAIHFAAGSDPKIPGVPSGLRATELPDAGVSVPFLEDFGRPARESACECERTSSVVLGPIMKLVNGPTVADALADPNNDLAKLVTEIQDDESLIEEVFLRFLARRPTEREIELAREALSAAGAEAHEIEQQYQEYVAALDRRQKDWEAEFQADPNWYPQRPEAASSSAGAKLEVGQDGEVRATGTRAHDTYQVVLVPELDKITGLRIEALASDDLPAKGPGRADNGNFVLSEIRMSVQSSSGSEDSPRSVPLQAVAASFSQSGWDVRGAVDGNEATGWAVSPRFGRNHEAVFATKQPVRLAAGDRLVVELVQKYPDGKHLLGKFRLAVTDSPGSLAPADVPDQIKQILGTPRDQRSEAQASALSQYFREQDAEYRRLHERREMVRRQAENKRLTGIQDLAWALINSPAFLFNR